MCCGKKRQQLDQAYNSTYKNSYHQNINVQKPANTSNSILFEYIGKTGLTVYGSVTGKKYRFNSNGMVVNVDLRDKNSLINVPNLRLVPNSSNALNI